MDEATAAHYRIAYRAAAAGEPLFRSASFDLHLDGRTLTWVIESCRPEDTRQTFLLEVVPGGPDDPDDLPRRRRERGWVERSFRSASSAYASTAMPGAAHPARLPVRALRVGRWFREAGGWRRAAATIDLSAARRR